MVRNPARQFVPALRGAEPLPTHRLARSSRAALLSGVGARPTAALSVGGPLGAARRYVVTVWTYTPATYAAAATAPGLATAGLAARSRPSATALEQVRTAGQTSTVRVTAAGLDAEASNGPATVYVSVVFTATVTYRGAGSGRPARHVWELRLTRAGGPWLVDAVLGAD